MLVEALVIRVLPRTTWIDVIRADMAFFEPLVHCCCHELRPIAVFQADRLTRPFDHFVDRLNDIRCARLRAQRIPAWAQRLKWRKQVEPDENRSCRSAQPARVRETHNTPSSTARSSCSIGRPCPSARRGGGGIRGIFRCQVTLRAT